jgi:hypothetical protein
VGPFLHVPLLASDLVRQPVATIAKVNLTERRILQASLSERSFDAWHVFAEDNGVTVTGLLEALGTQLAADIDVAGTLEVRQDWTRAARRVDAQRRRRKTNADSVT